MRILVTGGAGFIGSHTVQALLGRGDEVVVLDDLSRGQAQAVPEGARLRRGSIEDLATVRAALDGCEGVVHLAAKTSVPESISDPEGYARTNVAGTWNVLRAAADAGVGHVVLASSAAVYGPPAEDVQREGQVLRPLDPYGHSKLTNEVQAHDATASWGLSATALRFFNVYGPGQSAEGPYASVVPRFIDAAIHGRPMQVFGDGAQARDLVHVDDVVAAVLAGLGHDGHLVANVGTGHATAVLEVARHVAALHPGARWEHGAPRPGDVACSVADITRARQALGYAPSVPLVEGIKDTYDRAQAALLDGGPPARG